MGKRAADLDAVVFTDRNGTQVSLGDLFGDPGWVRYEDLIPQLRALMRAPDAPVYHRVLAAELLLQEADPVGLAQLIEWASSPDQVPWAVPPGRPPLNPHRHMGVDVSFEFLGDGLARSFLEEEQAPEVQVLQLEALKALLRLAPTHWLGSRVVSAIVLGEDLHDPLFATQLRDELRAAVTESVRRLRKGPPPKFDLDLQTIELLTFLVRLDDTAAAEAAEGLIEVLADDPQRLRDLRQALDGDAGPRTEAVRDRLDRLVATRSGPDNPRRQEDE